MNLKTFAHPQKSLYKSKGCIDLAIHPSGDDASRDRCLNLFVFFVDKCFFQDE